MIAYTNKQDMMNDPRCMVPISYDEIFKRVFGSKENPEITASLISLILNIPYESIKDKIVFSNTNNNKTINGKMDKDILFKVDVSKPLKISLEMNRYNKLYQKIISRNLIYHGDTLSSGIKTDDNYVNLPITIQINFNKVFVDTSNNEIIDIYTYRNRFGHILSEISQIYHINIKEMSKMWYDNKYQGLALAKKRLYLFGALILENEKIKFDNILKELNLDAKVKDELKGIVANMNNNEDLIERYYDKEAREKEDLAIMLEDAKNDGINIGKNQGIEIGKNQGIEIAKIAIAKSLLAEHIDIDTIIKTTNLSKEDISNLMN